MSKPILRGQVYYCDLGEQEGFIQTGNRPVLVVQSNYGNKHSPTTIVAPITTSQNNDLPTHFSIELEKKSIVLCEQLRTINIADLGKPLYYLNARELIILDQTLSVSLGIK